MRRMKKNSLEFHTTREKIFRSDVCIFAIYSHNGKVPEYTQMYIDNLCSKGVLVIACIATDNETNLVQRPRLKNVIATLVRENSSYDFGAWADALDKIPELWAAKRLIFTNDSLLVIPSLLGNLIKRLKSNSGDVVALTECSLPRQHFQTFFFMFQKNALKSERIKGFFREIKDFQDKKSVIDLYEIGLSSLLFDLEDCELEIIFNRQNMFPNIMDSAVSNLNPTHYFWDRLLDRGFPFVKMELLRDNPTRQSRNSLYRMLSMYKMDVKKVIEFSRLSRLGRKRRNIILRTLKEINRDRLERRRLTKTLK